MARVIRDMAEGGVSIQGLSVQVVELDAGAQLELSGDGETMAYVIDGRGETELGTLAPESLVWLDPGDALAVEAGADGLRLLVGHTG